jgi:hypothetical protein
MEKQLNNFIWHQFQISINATSVISSNGSITVTEQYEQNEKTLLDLYLSIEGKNLPATLVQKAQILGIANQCPESGGYSTYWARAWYYAISGTMVVPQGCMIAEDRGYEGTRLKSEDEQKGESFTISPNPAQDYFNLTLSTQTFEDEARICLMDLSGRTLLEQSLENSAATTKFYTQGIPNGIYLVGIRLVGRTQAVQKLAIIR